MVGSRFRNALKMLTTLYQGLGEDIWGQIKLRKDGSEKCPIRGREGNDN